MDLTDNSTSMQNTENTSILLTVSNVGASQVPTESEGDTSTLYTTPTTAKDNKKAWIVCISSFIIQVIVLGNLHVFGIYYICFLEEFKSSKAKTAWIGSLAYGIGMLFAPVASSIINKHGAHVSVGIGILFCTTSLFVSSAATSLTTLFGTYSLLYGLGIAMAYTPTMCIASEYFDKYLTVATGIMVAGSSTGTLVFSPISQALIDNLGWRNAFRIHGGIVFLLGPFCTYVLKPEAKPVVHRTSAEVIRKSMARRLMNDLQLWKNRVFLVWVSAIALVMFGYYIPYVHLVSYAVDIGVPPSKGSLLIMILGGFTAIGRITFGKVMAWGYLNRLNMHQLSMVVTGTAAMLLPLIKTFPGLVCYCIFVGLVDGCYVVLLPVLTTALVGSGGDSVLAWGYLTMVCSITYTFGPPVAGFLYDSTGSYDLPFHIAGIPLLVGAIILFFIPWAQRTADTTNPMSAAHTYTVDENTDRESLATEFGSIAATDRMAPIPEITIDLDKGESYVVPLRIKHRKRDTSMCSELSGVSEMATDAVDEVLRQGLGFPHCTGSQAASLATSPRVRFDGPMRASNPQILLTPTREDGASFVGMPNFTLTITSPQQILTPESSRGASMANSPRSFMDQQDSVCTSPPTGVRIIRQKSSNLGVSSDVTPVQVEICHGPPKTVARGPPLSKTVHYKSSPDIIENNRDFCDQQTQKPLRVHFTPQVKTLESSGSLRSTNDAARKISSNPEIFPPDKNQLLGGTDFRTPTRLYCRTSNPTVFTDSNTTPTTNPFMPNYSECPNQHEHSTETEKSDGSQKILSTSDDSNTSTSTVKARDKSVDGLGFDPMKSPTEEDDHDTGIQEKQASNSSSYVFVEATNIGELQTVDVSAFDPISYKTSESETSVGCSAVQAGLPIPAIPPPPPNNTRRTPRVSESRISESDTFPLQMVLSQDSNQLSPSASSVGFDPSRVSSDSRQGLDIPAGDASSDRPPGSPRSPDAVGIFDMTDLIFEDEQANNTVT